MKKLLAIVLAITVGVSIFFASGCSKGANTVTVYEFKDDYKAGTEIAKNMFVERKVDVTEGFVTTGGVVYTPEKLSGMRLVTSGNWDALMGAVAYLNQSGRKGDLLFPYHIVNKPVMVDVLRLCKNIEAGTQITAEHLEVVSARRDSVPAGIISDPNLAIGKYAASGLFAGNYLTSADLAHNPTPDNNTHSRNERTAVTLPLAILNYSGGLSGQLQDGDVVRFYTKQQGNDVFSQIETQIEALAFVEVGGVSADGIAVLVNEVQARILTEYVATSEIHLALIYRGTAEKAQEYLRRQDEYLQGLQAN